MRRALTPFRLAAAGLVLLAVTALILWLVPSNDFLLLPDPAHPVAPLVTVKGEQRPRGPGGIYFVDVLERHASLLESLFPGLRSEATLVPGNELAPPGTSDKARIQQDLREMARSQKIAAAVALRQLGYRVRAQPVGVIVDAVDPTSHAAGVIQPTDVIVAAGGKPVRTIADLRSALADHRVGDVVALTVRRGDQQLHVRVRTSAAPDDPHRPIVGFAPDQAADVRLPIPVRIDAGGVGGPSAGLAFALEVMEKLGRDVDRGHRVAATGQINLNGSVSPIGGVKQKTIGARRAKVDVFLVPAGDNAREARKYAHGLRIVAVRNFKDALHALAALPQEG
jgi:PDZ domain-containing protein